MAPEARVGGALDQRQGTGLPKCPAPSALRRVGVFNSRVRPRRQIRCRPARRRARPSPTAARRARCRARRSCSGPPIRQRLHAGLGHVLTGDPPVARVALLETDGLSAAGAAREPARPHDRVRQPAFAQGLLGPTAPVDDAAHLRVALRAGNVDLTHEHDVGGAPFGESAGHDVARAAVVRLLGTVGVVVGDRGLDDHHRPVGAAHRPLDARSVRDVAPEDLRSVAERFPSAGGVAGEHPDGAAPFQELLHDVASGPAGAADDENLSRHPSSPLWGRTRGPSRCPGRMRRCTSCPCRPSPTLHAPGCGHSDPTSPTGPSPGHVAGC